MTCKICKSSCSSVYNFGKQALANDFLFDKDCARKAPLELVMCDKCKTLQLKHMVSPQSIFSNDYKYKSYANAPLLKHFQKLHDYVCNEYSVGLDNNILDIGCNDGSFISLFNKYCAVGVDPASEFDGSIVQYKKYFDQEFADEYLTSYDYPRVITALNVLAHVPDVHAFVKSIRSIMSEKTILIIEVQNSQQLYCGVFDQIYHEHYFYFNEQTLTYLLNQHDIQVINYINFPNINGGTLRVECKIGKQVVPVPPVYTTYTMPDSSFYLTQCLENGIENIRNLFQNYLIHDRKLLIGCGAPAKAALMCSQIDELKTMKYCLDTTSDKSGRYIPGTHIPIKYDHGNTEIEEPANVFIFSWNYFENIMSQHNNFKGHVVICPHPAEIIMCN